MAFAQMTRAQIARTGNNATEEQSRFCHSKPLPLILLGTEPFQRNTVGHTVGMYYVSQDDGAKQSVTLHSSRQAAGPGLTLISATSVLVYLLVYGY